MSYKKINNVKKRDGDSYYMYIEFINLEIYNSLIQGFSLMILRGFDQTRKR